MQKFEVSEKSFYKSKYGFFLFFFFLSAICLSMLPKDLLTSSTGMFAGIC